MSDLLESRRLGVSEQDVAIFRSNLSKDELPRGRGRDGGVFVKHNVDAETAQAEERALTALGAAVVPGEEELVPRLVGRRGVVVEMALVEGIRVFDLLRLLESRRDAPEHLQVLHARLTRRLDHIQQTLTDSCATTSPYPFDIKVDQALALLGRLLGAAPAGRPEIAEFEAMRRRWESLVAVPFRDAVVKNMILADPRLSVRRGLSDSERLAVLNAILDDDPLFLEHAPIWDVDFSSTAHLTSVADDWISLQMHESPTRARHRAGLPLSLPDSVTGAELALTLYVRFVRFGGRKMAYRLLAPDAAHRRFAFDDAGWYFRHLPGLLDQADPSFAQEFPFAVARIRALSTLFAAAEFPQPSGMADGYWQESPLELDVRIDG